MSKDKVKTRKITARTLPAVLPPLLLPQRRIRERRPFPHLAPPAPQFKTRCSPPAPLLRGIRPCPAAPLNRSCCRFCPNWGRAGLNLERCRLPKLWCSTDTALMSPRRADGLNTASNASASNTLPCRLRAKTRLQSLKTPPGSRK